MNETTAPDACERSHRTHSQSARKFTVDEWLEHWLTTIAPRRVRPLTLHSYRSCLRLHVIPVLGDILLSELSPEDLEQLLARMEGKALSAATQVRIFHILSRSLKVAAQRGHIPVNVATLVDAPSVKRRDTAHPLTREEARAVLRAAVGRRNAARWTVALALGLRQSEALALGWADFDSAAQTLRVRRGLHRVAGRGLIFEEPKTERSRRTLVLPTPLVETLQAHRVRQLEERTDAGQAWEENDLIFAQANGRPIDRRDDYQQWTRLLRDAGVRHVRLHDARHTAATLLLAEGIHPRVVMELLGHSQMKTTMDIYSHVMPGLAREAADAMAGALLR